MMLKVKVFWGYFRAVILAVIAGLAIVTAAEIEKIPDSSMSPDVAADDFVFINKAVYVYKEPEIGELVAVRSRLHTKSGGGAVVAARVSETESGEAVLTLPGGESAETADILGRVEFIVWPLEHARQIK